MIIRKTLISKVAVAISIQMFLVLASFLFISAVILYILDMLFLSYTSIGKKRVDKYTEKL